MAKPRIPNQRKANLEHKMRTERYAVIIQRMYDQMAQEAARLASLSDPDGSRPFSFADYPFTKRNIRRLQLQLASDVRAVIMAGTSEEWKESNLVQNLVARKVLTAYTGTSRSGDEFTRYYQTNPDALRAFQERRDEGMNLSNRVWNLSEQYKAELEEAITAAIAPGTSAVELAAGVKKYLKDPDKRFRRIKEKMEDGTIKWHLSNPAKAYHPGRGVYRSSARNAQRLARTEINMAYRTAEQKRWEQFDFVVGYEVKTTQNGHHVADICDQLAGKYPKDFKFTGWHPQCMCYCIPILKTEDEFWSLDEDRPSANEVRDVPANFKEWVEDNSDRIEKAEKKGTLPYFIRDNKEVVEKAMSGEPTMKAVPMASNVTEAERKARALVEDNRRRVEEATGYPCGEPMDFDQANEMRGNPNYKKGVKFRVNCQSSVLANEMRRRGFDVEAYGNTKQDWFMPSVLAKKPEIAFMDANGELPVPKPIRFNRDLLSSLDGEMKEMGRYHLRFRFANDGGHIITAERLPDGSLRIYDPQSGKTIKDFSEYATKVKQDSFEYYRVDNLQINPEVAKGAVKIAKSKGDAPRMQLPEIKEFLEKGWYGNGRRNRTREEVRDIQHRWNKRKLSIAESSGEPPALIVDPARRVNASINKREKEKFEKEYRMASTYASFGHKVEMLEEIPGVSSPDAVIDGLKVDFKSLNSANNIERHAKDAIYKQGSDEVWFEFSEMNDEIKQKLCKISGWGIHGNYYIKGEGKEYRF